MNELEQKEQFQQWLPFYVNGRLGSVERQWMSQYLAQHPNASVDLDIEEVIKATLHAELPQFGPNQGLDAFMKRVRTETLTSRAASKTSAWQGFLEQCQNMMSSLFTSPRWAMAITLMIVQTGLIGVLLTQRTAPILSEQTEWRSVGDPQKYQGPVLQVTFKSTATEEEMRLLMVKIQGSFLSGPGQLGNYIVKVPQDSIEAAGKQVTESNIIESVSLLPEVPVER